MVNALARQAREDGSIPFIRSKKEKTLFLKNNNHYAKTLRTLHSNFAMWNKMIFDNIE